MSDSNAKQHHEGHRQRLRERFRAAGLDALLDHEVLELLLTYSIPRRDTKPLAWALLKKFGTLSGVLDAKPQELSEVPGMGRESVTLLTLLRAVMKRYFMGSLQKKEMLRSPDEVVDFCRASLEGEKDEIFEVLYLTIKNTVIGCERLSSGTIDRAAVSPRRVVENSLKARAASLILVHNHPSGNATPSREDILITEEIIRAARALDIAVLDHIIIGKNEHYSFRASGVIKFER
ncbi:MAG: DNA repair protein RadC [Elusimicrobiaceae bacterium]|nr:DNA repair protein RadC [Elusimicrobiaceae bacterium]